jgi:hypothetical protein
VTHNFTADALHTARDRIRWCPRVCMACRLPQTIGKLEEIEALADDGQWYCEHCGHGPYEIY